MRETKRKGRGNLFKNYFRISRKHLLNLGLFLFLYQKHLEI